MDVTIRSGKPLSGRVTAPASKSAAHRAAICAALAHGRSALSPVELTADMVATIRAIEALGGKTSYMDNTLEVQGVDPAVASGAVECGESGSTLRFMVPVTAALGVNARFYGKGRLPARPMTPLTDALKGHGVEFTRQGDEILTVEGQLRSGIFAIPGGVSSQYITGLLLALPLLTGDSEIRLTSPLQSRGYVDMTMAAMATCGVTVKQTGPGWHIPGGQRYRSKNLQVEGDYSGGAFWLCGGALQKSGFLTVEGLSPGSLQGDRAVVDILKRMGGAVKRKGHSVTAGHSALTGVDIDAGDIPDLVPILAVTAALAKGTTRIYNAGRNRIKESDRLSTVTTGLRILGADVVEEPESLIITGKKQLKGGTVDSFADHRIAMAMGICALGCAEPVTIIGAECVDKSYPHFWAEYKRLGGNLHGIWLG